MPDTFICFLGRGNYILVKFVLVFYRLSFIRNIYMERDLKPLHKFTLSESKFI